MPVPSNPKIYHIVHVDRLPSIISDGYLWCDAEIERRKPPGTTIGMNHIKQRRLNELTLDSHSDLYVGDCVPFYFCPRSVMLYIIYRANDQALTYRDGQNSIIHLVSDLRASVKWAEQNDKRWAFTLSNAGAYYAEDRCDLAQLDEIKWDAVKSDKWGGNGFKEGKQAEFLMEYSFPWELVQGIGVFKDNVYNKVVNALPAGGHRPTTKVMKKWYY